jgi:hypothetical protein
MAGGCKYHTRISSTILERVSVSATWKACMLSGG